MKKEIEKPHTFDSGYLSGESHLKNDGMQNHLEFHPASKYFKTRNKKKYIFIT